MNVLFVSDTRFTHSPYRNGSTRYRCYHVAEAIQAAGHLADVTSLESIELVNLSRYDVVNVHRPTANPKLHKLLERCESLGIKTVADVDLLGFDPSLAEESTKAQLNSGSIAVVRKEFMRQQVALQSFDEVCVATEELARVRRLQAPNQTVYVAPNGLSNFWLSCNDKIQIQRPTSKRIGYISGSRGGEADFAGAAKFINQFLKKTSDSELHVVGPLNLSDDLIEPSKVTRGAWTDFMNMPSELVKTWVNVAPLSNTSMNYAKPHTKFIESAAFGVPVVCSPTSDLKRHDVPGLHLVENTEQWLQAFEALSDKRYYESCQKALYEYVRDTCLASHSTQALIERWSANNENSKDENLTTLSAAI